MSFSIFVFVPPSNADVCYGVTHAGRSCWRTQPPGQRVALNGLFDSIVELLCEVRRIMRHRGIRSSFQQPAGTAARSQKRRSSRRLSGRALWRDEIF